MGLILDDLQVENTLTGAGMTTAADARIAAQKGVANGICELDGSGLVPSNRLPSFVDDALEFANLAAFPVTGETSKIYVALDSNKTYRWSGTVYTEISPSDVNSVFGRTGNVTAQTGDYTPAQVGADPVGSAASAQAFSIQRANHSGTQLANTISNFEAATRSTVLTGIDTAVTEIEITAADTILQALGKLQGQVNLWTELITTADLSTNSGTTFTSVTELGKNVVAGMSYYFEYTILFQSTNTGTGIALSLNGSGLGGQVAGIVNIPISAVDGTAALFTGNITSFGDVVIGSGAQATNTTYVANIKGVFQSTATGTFYPVFRSETAFTTVRVMTGSVALLREF